MKQPAYLKSFEYSIPASEKDFVKINIDFVNKCLSLKANGRGFDSEMESVQVNARMNGGSDINLPGSSDEEMVFLLEGTIDDGKIKNSCSGLIVIDKWNLRVCLYDNTNDDMEIKLDLMTYSVSPNAALN
jgi:hypothetical protein